jgi:uncharacterized protein (DUF952 family)
MSGVLVRIMTSWDGGDVVPDPDGFVHLSFAQQVEQTVQRHYASAASLVFLVLDERALPPDALRIEDSGGHGAYPHLYATLPATAVVTTVPWRRGEPIPDQVR